jgi:hypothetical protein
MYRCSLSHIFIQLTVVCRLKGTVVVTDHKGCPLTPTPPPSPPRGSPRTRVNKAGPQEDSGDSGEESDTQVSTTSTAFVQALLLQDMESHAGDSKNIPRYMLGIRVGWYLFAFLVLIRVDHFTQILLLTSFASYAHIF